MRALFVGGTVDNSELDLAPGDAPKYYPHDDANALRASYRLYEIGRHDGEAAYAVYAALDTPDDEVERIISEREYPRRFGADQRDLVH